MGRKPTHDFPNLVPGRRGLFKVPPAGALAVSCWCEREFIAVDGDKVRAGQTDTCGHPDCKPPPSEIEGTA